MIKLEKKITPPQSIIIIIIIIRIMISIEIIIIIMMIMIIIMIIINDRYKNSGRVQGNMYKVLKYNI